MVLDDGVELGVERRNNTVGWVSNLCISTFLVAVGCPGRARRVEGRVSEATVFASVVLLFWGQIGCSGEGGPPDAQPAAQDTYIREDRVVQEIRFRKNSRLFFHENGKVKEGLLAQETRIDGMLLKKNRRVYFHEDGKLSKGILAEDIRIDGLELKGQRWIHFNQKGMLTKG